MTGTVTLDFEERGGAIFAFLTLDRAGRANSLVPEFVDQLNDRLDALASGEIAGVVLQSAGKFFSSGGDIEGFASHSGSALLDYADHVVGSLQRAVLKLYAMPVPVITRLQGGVTGGAAGLVFAADLVAMDEKAFIQPYYSEVGFAPDGGWTTLLAEKLPVGRAFAVQALNSRLSAEEALALGLANQLAPVNELDSVVDCWLETLSAKKRQTIQATKRLLRSEEGIARMKSGLEAERRAFLELISLPETASGMERFLA